MGIPLEFLSQFCEVCPDLLYYKTGMFPCTIYTNLALVGLNRACITDVYIYKLLQNLTNRNYVYQHVILLFKTEYWYTLYTAHVESLFIAINSYVPHVP